jgi:hypothetical protein
MSATFTIYEKAGNIFARIPLAPEGASTFHSNCFTLDKVAAVAKVISIIRDTPIIYLCAVTLPEISDDYTDEEELEWDTLFAQPHVQAGLDCLAQEAERQFAAGETVEGGFAVE